MKRGLLKEGQTVTGAGDGPGWGEFPTEQHSQNPKKESQEAPQSQKIPKSLRLGKT